MGIFSADDFNDPAEELKQCEARCKLLKEKIADLKYIEKLAVDAAEAKRKLANLERVYVNNLFDFCPDKSTWSQIECVPQERIAYEFARRKFWNHMYGDLSFDFGSPNAVKHEKEDDFEKLWSSARFNHNAPWYFPEPVVRGEE